MYLHHMSSGSCTCASQSTTRRPSFMNNSLRVYSPWSMIDPFDKNVLIEPFPEIGEQPGNAQAALFEIADHRRVSRMLSHGFTDPGDVIALDVQVQVEILHVLDADLRVAPECFVKVVNHSESDFLDRVVSANSGDRRVVQEEL